MAHQAEDSVQCLLFGFNWERARVCIEQYFYLMYCTSIYNSLLKCNLYDSRGRRLIRYVVFSILLWGGCVYYSV